MSLQQLLDDTIPHPPRFASVDELIARERRTLRRRRWTVAGAATAVLAIIVSISVSTGVPFLPAPGRGTNPFQPAADPTQRLLDDAVRAALEKEAPDVQWLNRRPPESSTDPWWYSAWVTTPDPNVDGPTYVASAVLRTGGLVGTLTVNVGRELEPTAPQCPKPTPVGTSSCVTSTGPHGEMIMSVGITYPVPSGEPHQFENAVDVVRLDGTHIYISSRNQSGTFENDAATDKPAPLTVQQLLRVALSPAITACASLSSPAHS